MSNLPAKWGYQPNDIEQAIVNRLAPLRGADLLVHALPERPQEYGELLEQFSGALTVVVLDESPKKPGADVSTHAIEHTATVWGKVKGVRGEAGLGPIKVNIRNQLLGFMPPGCGRMSYKEGYKFLGRTDTHWEFQVSFKFTQMLRIRQ